MSDLPSITAADVTAWVTAISTVGGVVFGVYKYFTGRDRQIAIRDAFQNVVTSLSSENPVKRQAAAILLRRFLDPKTELGQKGTPYAREAIGVIAAILRTERSGELQKLLADGLRDAESLAQADLQKANLQNAYLGKKNEDDPAPNLSGVDFYRADLASASLRGAIAQGAIFYQACLHNTILRNADLRKANFYEADLLGANLKGAKLTRASFGNARNLPEGLEEHLDNNGKYVGPDPFDPRFAPNDDTNVQVFLSKPGILSVKQRTLVTELKRLLAAEGIGVVTLERDGYPGFGAAAHVRREISGCAGAVILGFRQLEIVSGYWRSETEEAKSIEAVALPTVWNHIEAGMATMAGLPLLCINEVGVAGGMFGFEDVDNSAFEVNLDGLNFEGLAEKISDWSHSVREAAN
ncbi:MAG: pentapeptide repeat-containing protein [Pseudomonadota bacterium]